MKIVIETIPHKEQRYPTVGDWYYDADDALIIKVSDLGDWRQEALVAVHELVEVLLCKHKGVSQLAVDQFDANFESNREELNQDEPGDDPDASYKAQHYIATGIERILAAELGVDWKAYESNIQAL